MMIIIIMTVCLEQSPNDWKKTERLGNNRICGDHPDYSLI